MPFDSHAMNRRTLLIERTHLQVWWLPLHLQYLSVNRIIKPWCRCLPIGMPLLPEQTSRSKRCDRASFFVSSLYFELLISQVISGLPSLLPKLFHNHDTHLFQPEHKHRRNHLNSRMLLLSSRSWWWFSWFRGRYASFDFAGSFRLGHKPQVDEHFKQS